MRHYSKDMLFCFFKVFLMVGKELNNIVLLLGNRAISIGNPA